MASEIEDLINDKVEDIAVKDVAEQAAEHQKNRWQVWVALSSSLLAVLSVLAALVANFASDEASIALSNDSDYSAYAEGVSTSQTLLKVKLELLASLGKPATAGDIEELKKFEDQAREFRERAQNYEQEGDRAFKVHDTLAIAMTLFQVTMLLSGVAVMVNRLVIWRLGLAFSAVGIVFLIRGLAGYMD